MERIAEKLSEIEKTARAIVDNAQEQKHQMEMQMQKKRDAFDADMEKETNEKILKIQSDLATNMENLLKKQEEQNNNEIEVLKQDFPYPGLGRNTPADASLIVRTDCGR